MPLCCSLLLHLRAWPVGQVPLSFANHAMTVFRLCCIHLLLLQAAVRQPDTTVLCRLCHLPAAQALTAADTGGLLETALTDTAVCSVSDTVCALCEVLPGTQDLAADRLQQLMRAALPQAKGAAARYLRRLPAGKDLCKAASAAAGATQAMLGSVAASSSQDAADAESASSTRSRSSSPNSDSMLGRALSSSSSNSSSPVSRRSRRSTSSSSGSSTGKGKGCRSALGVGALCQQQLSGSSKLLQPGALEALLLPC